MKTQSPQKTIATIFVFILMVTPKVYAEGLDASSLKTIEQNKKRSYLSVLYENDLIGSGDDKYYTSGVQLSYNNIDRHPSPFVAKIADDIFGFRVNQATAISFVLGQKIYTPKDITVSSAQPDDRPWAGWLYTGLSLANITDQHIDKMGMMVGVVGPASLAEQTQKTIHKNITGSPRPQGWDNQLHSEMGVMLTYDRRWPHYKSFDMGDYRFQFEPNVSLSLGNIYTFAGAGMTVTFGPNQKELRDTPPRVFPATPGSGYFDLPKSRQWDWFTFASVNGRAIARDIFLDGNTFRDSASIDKKNFVMDTNIGLALTYDDYRVTYTVTHRSKEFYGQDDPAVFGSISLSHRF